MSIFVFCIFFIFFCIFADFWNFQWFFSFQLFWYFWWVLTFSMMAFGVTLAILCDFWHFWWYFGIFGDFWHFRWFSAWSSFFLGNIKVRWWEILFEALEKSIWPCLRNTARTEVTLIFVTEEEDRGGGIGHSSSLMGPWDTMMTQVWGKIVSDTHGHRCLVKPAA